MKDIYLNLDWFSKKSSFLFKLINYSLFGCHTNCPWQIRLTFVHYEFYWFHMASFKWQISFSSLYNSFDIIDSIDNDFT